MLWLPRACSTVARAISRTWMLAFWTPLTILAKAVPECWDHLVVLKRMVEASALGALLLLDEIASGTDPSQGAALAQAILERMVTAGARVVVTTHFGPLKGLALVDPRFSVAAMQYLEGRPTYRVIPGATGESHAFGIAARIGLDPEILDRAASLVGSGERDLSEVLSALDRERGEAHQLKAELDHARARVAEREAALARREAEILARSKALEANAAEKFMARLKQAEKAVGEVVAGLQRAPDHKGAEAARATIQALKGLVPATEPPPAPAPPGLKVGDRVKIRGIDRVGEVVAIGDASVQVRAGSLTVNTKAESLERVDAPAPKPVGAVSVTLEERPPALADAVRFTGNTLDLRGKRVEEGHDAADLFFDRMIGTNHQVVFLLHGHGTGALKDALRAWLGTHPQVRDWTPANPDQGGDAFTAVLLR